MWKNSCFHCKFSLYRVTPYLKYIEVFTVPWTFCKGCFNFATSNFLYFLASRQFPEKKERDSSVSKCFTIKQKCQTTLKVYAS